MQFYVPLPISTSFIERSLLKNYLDAKKKLSTYILVKRLENNFLVKKKQKNGSKFIKIEKMQEN